MYYFGNYSESLYQYEKNQTQASLLNHTTELQRIIKKSKRLDLPVPPGIYAELGYIKLKANKKEEAIFFFSAEAALYPESKLFMDRLIFLAQKKDKKNDPDITMINNPKKSLVNKEN